MNWPDWAAVSQGHPDLAAERLIPIHEALLGEAVQTVKDDLAGRYDIEDMDKNGDIPIQVVRLAVYKARDLGYVSYWGGEPPAGTSAPEWRKRYAELLANVKREAVGDLARYVRENRRESVRFV